MSVLSASGLSVRFGDVLALDGVDLAVADGEFVAVVGPSGCGKSTLLRALGGMLPPAATVSGELTLPTLPDGGAATAWMPQRDGLLPWRRAWSNALLGARIARVPRADAEARAAELFETFGLAGFERAWPHELSGGMRQRLALLRTCLAGRPVLLLDEPFGALDPITRRRMNEWLAGVGLADAGRQSERAAGVGQRAVVLVTHDVDEALALADRVVVLGARPGRVVLDAAAPSRDEVLAALEPLPGRPRPPRPRQR
ncbi:ABC transporter ATP-binding protein [Promicromonospora sp. MEB111]|uniref:ABC transporter ATP-binding protein n=1 Tax=Promicromonospora sp. MEB111 TaxID=3040301 RepID=UPI00254FCDFC|nr:ABC transporter ATP-binding protein [Promicromonospora sp. MEB111]